MNINSLVPASALALKLGVKSIVHGGPGQGKTPLFNTAPRPILLATEPGMLSMRASNIPTWEAYTHEKVDEFFKWWMSDSREISNFDTLGIDSASQLAEIFLLRAEKKLKDGRAAYGDMSDNVMFILRYLYFQPNKHMYIICKQGFEDVQGVRQSRPFFPGKDLNTKIPHMFDLILSLGTWNIPGYGQAKAFRTAPSLDTMARDRSGRLAEYEPPDLTAIFNKAMS